MIEAIVALGEHTTTCKPIPIVRCRDCRHYGKNSVKCYRWMTLDCFENPVPSDVKPDGFCAWGEREVER